MQTPAISPPPRRAENASEQAHARLLAHPGEPLLFADWARVLMIHLEMDAGLLQRAVPFPLDLFAGRAFVTLVAFTLEGMRSRVGGHLGALLMRPIATHDFLNVRTYVRQGGEPGIHFLAEWLSNWLAVQIGPRTFGLPYRHGRIAYQHNWNGGMVSGSVTDVRSGSALAYGAKPLSDVADTFKPCAEGSLDEWLMERYTAFNDWHGRQKYFRIWHPPWPQQPVAVAIHNHGLLAENWPWMVEGKQIGANYSPGVKEVAMGRPHHITRPYYDRQRTAP